jgi:hypothetical protein
MLAYAISTILLVIIGGFMFGLSQPNVQQASTLTLAMGQLLVACHQAAVTFAQQNPGLGTVLGGYALTNPNISSVPSGCQSLNPIGLNGLSVSISPGSALPNPMGGRVVETWLDNGHVFAGSVNTPQVVREVLQVMHDDPSVGLCCNAGGQIYPPVIATSGTQTGAPPAVPILFTKTAYANGLPSLGAIPGGAIVMQTVISP